MPNRVTGMFSGMDTESLIRDLVKARSGKVDKLNKEKTKLEWKQEKWTDLNKKVKSLFSKTVSNLRWSTSYMKKTSKASNSNAVSIITGEKAMNSVQSLSIEQLATSGYLTGAKVETADGTQAKGDTTLVKDLIMNDEDGNKVADLSGLSTSGSFTVTAKGVSTDIIIDDKTTISSVVEQLNKAGVSANFDEKNQRLFIGAVSSGKDADFTITANDSVGNTALNVLGINAKPSAAQAQAYKDVADLSSYMVETDGAFDAEATVANILTDTTSKAYSKLMEFAKTNFTSEVNKQSEKVAEIEKKIKELEETDKSAFTDEDTAAYEAELASLNESLTAEKATYEDMNTNLKAGVYSDEALNAAAKSLNERIKFAANVDTDTALYNKDAVRLTGDDARINLNGATFTSSTNSIEVNGLTFICHSIASDITITTEDDTDGIYDMIKGFVKEYNTLINEMDSLYNAESPKGMEPLTDEEKDALSDSEVEKIEKKIKESVLRKDETLSTLFNGLRDSMSAGFELASGKKMYLSDFGIETLNYFSAPDGEKNAYHIDGDPDDANSAGNADKLKSMIASDPDTVVEFFTGLARNLYSKMDELSAGSDYSTYGVFYDDKQMKKDLSDYESKIADAQKKLQDYEDKYYDKFSAMEVALSKMQSNTNYLSGLFS